MNFQEGQHVKQDEVLATIDPRLFQAALDQAKAKKAQDEAQLVSDLKDLERARSLSEQKFASVQSVDQLTAKVGVDRALIQADEAMIKTAETNLSYTTITAPFSGRIGLRAVDPGNIVRANDATRFHRHAHAAGSDCGGVHPSRSASLPRSAKRSARARCPSSPTTRMERKPIAKGKLAVIDNLVDQRVGHHPPQGDLRKCRRSAVAWAIYAGPGANGGEAGRHRRSTATAIQRGPNGLYVWLASPDQRALMQPVETGPAFETVTAVEKGLAAGDQVIMSNYYRLAAG